MEAALSLFTGPFAPWLPLAIALILLATAAWDARTGIVPNIPLACGAALWLGGRLVTGEWRKALVEGVAGLAAWGLLWALNEGWYRVFKKDAIGMGDAKWTALAIMAFGLLPALFAWFAGAWFAIAWIGACYVLHQRIRKVYFAPFLFCGLTLGLLIAHGVIVLPYPFTL